MTRTTWPKPARTAFEAKVCVLEGWVRDGVLPDNAPPLSTINDVRLWTDAELGLRSWTSYSVAAPGGEHSDLRDRLDLVLPEYVELRAGPANKSRKPRRGIAISQKQVELERNRLVEQNADLIMHNAVLSSEVLRLEWAVSELERQNKELIVANNKIIPIKRRN